MTARIESDQAHGGGQNGMHQRRLQKGEGGVERNAVPQTAERRRDSEADAAEGQGADSRRGQKQKIVDDKIQKEQFIQIYDFHAHMVARWNCERG